MKKFFSILMLSLLLIPLNLCAASSKDKKEEISLDLDDYETMNLEEALTQEVIEHDLSNYKESDKQVTIYLFRAKGCAYCKAFLTYLNTIVEEYGKKFKLVSFEVWNDSENADLYAYTRDYMLGDGGSGVPFIIIGDKTFPGYSVSYQEDIEEAIDELYEQDVKDRYDVFEDMIEARKPDYSMYLYMGLIALVFVTISTVGIIIYENNKITKLEEKIVSLEKIVKKDNKQENKDSKEEKKDNKEETKEKKKDKDKEEE